MTEPTAPAPTGRAPARLGALRAAAEGTFAGRVLLDTLERTTRVEIFDRAMALAAQIFTSVVPILVLLAVTARQADARDLADSIGVTPGMRRLFDQVLSGGASLGTFGVLGVLLVLVSSTSLSRALARVYASVWELPRPSAKPSTAWRWVAVAVAFAISILAVRALARLGEAVPPAPVSGALTVALGYALLLWPVSRLLVDGRVSWRALLPGALVGGLVIALVARVSQALWLPRALAASEERYGALGVAFTYLSLLYVMAWGLIAALALGAALVRVEGPVRRWAERSGASSS